jgi:hypothetical protein
VIGTTRARTTRYNPRKTFFQRHRALVLGGVALVVIVGLGAVAYSAATAPAYACTTEWQPEVTPPPEPGATPRLGYVQQQMGRTHVQPGDFVRYPFCPPASGNHINLAGSLGPIPPRVYGPDNRVYPMNWIHNLEHGGLVVLYRCETSSAEACTDAGQDALRAFFSKFPNSPICNLPAGSLSPVIARFDQMAWPYAALLWGQVLPLETLDTEQIIAFFNQQAERTNPEQLCPQPTPTPAGSASPAPSGSASPAPSGSTAPSVSPSASPAASPSPAASESPASS